MTATTPFPYGIDHAAPPCLYSPAMENNLMSEAQDPDAANHDRPGAGGRTPAAVDRDSHACE